MWKLEQFTKLVKEIGLQKAMAMIDGQEVVDADGNPVDIQAINLESGGGDDGATEDEGGEANTEADSEKKISEQVHKAVKAAMAEHKATGSRINGDIGGSKARIVPAKARRTRVKHFIGEDAEFKAYGFGQLVAAANGNTAAKSWLQDRGLYKVQTEGDDSAGGVLVPDEFANDLIRLTEEYGVFRRNANVVPMTRETLRTPRVVSEGAATFVGEATAPTAVDDEFDSVLLVAKKMIRLTRVSSELMADAAMAVGDILARSIAIQFAKKEDETGFTGTGLSSDGGIYGLAVKIDDGNHTASVATAATGNTSFGELDLVDMHKVVGQCPEYALPNAKWYFSAAGFANGAERLAHAAGGATATETANGIERRFLGYPVEITQVLNSTLTAQTDTIIGLFGDLSLSSSFGDRQAISIATSEDRYFDTDETAVRATQRIDINNHDLGNTSTAGPIIALDTPAS